MEVKNTMNQRVGLLMAILMVLVLLGSLFFSIGFAQNGKKSLDIRRHADEPLELVELKVDEQSLKAKIKTKFRNRDDEKEGLDTVEFEGREDWLKRIALALRNVSGKRITGLTAYLYLRPKDSRVLFSVTLTRAGGELESAALDPGETIEVIMDAASLDQALMRLRAYGADPNEATVSLSVEMVAFSDGVMWNRGKFVRKDPTNPNRKIPVHSNSPPDESRSNHRRGALVRESSLSFGRFLGKSISPTLTSRPPQSLERCVLFNGSYQAEYCDESAICFTGAILTLALSRRAAMVMSVMESTACVRHQHRHQRPRQVVLSRLTRIVNFFK